MKDLQFTRMIIVEAISEELASDVRNLMDAHVADLELPYVKDSFGFISSHRLSEDGGAMVVLEMNFKDRRWATSYATTTAYRFLAEKLEPLIVGEPVIKYFRRFSYTEVMA